MYQRDYIMRMVEQLTAGIAQIAGLQREQKHQDALYTVDELLSRLFRMNARLIRSLSADDLIAMMRVNGHLETEPLLAMAELLKEEGDILRNMGRPDEAYYSHLKAIELLLAIDVEGTFPEQTDLHRSISGLIERLNPFQVPPETQRTLWLYFEQRGQYAIAENWLFEWLEGAEDNECVDEAIHFYNRLLMRPDEELAAGNLPRDEVIEGLELLQRR